MSSTTLIHNDLLKALNDAIAERDAEIAQLKAELAGVIEGHKAQIYMLAQVDFEERQIAQLKAELAGAQQDVALLNRQLNGADQIVRAGEAERKALAAQVAELQAWKDAVPVDAICRVEMTTTKQFMLGATAIGYSVDDFDADRAAINGWLKAERPD